MKALLLVGDGDSIHIKSLVKEYKKAKPDLRIDLLDIKLNSPLNVNFHRTYSSSLMLVWDKYIGRLYSVGWFLHVLFWSFLRKDRVKYDAIHIHYLSLIHRFVMSLYSKQCHKLVSIVWGSDVFRCKDKRVLKSILLKSNLVNCSTPEIEKEVQAIAASKIPVQNIRKCKFGLSNLNAIIEFKSNPAADKSLGQLSRQISEAKNTKKIITIGYNASAGQQHLEIIKSLAAARLDEECLFIFPMTYGDQDGHLETVKTALEKTELDFLIIDNYLSTEEVAFLRVNTDVLIQLQITDGLSGSMQEHLYAEGHVITGSWLPYNDLRKIGVEFETIDHTADIGVKLTQDLLLLDVYKKKNAKNKKLIWELSSFEAVINDWLLL